MDKRKLAIILVLLTTILTALGQFMLKKASAKLAFDFIALITNYYLIIGIIAYAAGFFILFIALRWGELSLLYPLMALGFVWVSLLSVFYLGELVTFVNWIGLVLIIAGVAFIGGAQLAH